MNLNGKQFGVLVLAGAMLFGGWQLWKWMRRPVAVEYQNLKYIQLLTTAVSARNLESVERVEQTVKQRHDEGTVSEKEWAHFQRVVAIARSEKWEQADRACYEFASAQLNRRRKAPPPTDHGHDHSHAHEHAR